MGLPYFPKASRRMQRTLKDLRVSLLCFLLTFLVLRNTIGAGKFGTPAQDFEEIRLHLHNVGMHRRHLRALTQAAEEEKSLREVLKSEKKRSPIYAESEDEDGGQRWALPVGLGGWKGKGKAPSAEKDDWRSTAASFNLKEMQGKAASLTLDIRRGNSPLLVVEKEIPVSLLAMTKQFEGPMLSNLEELRRKGGTPAHGESKVVVVPGFHFSDCKKSPLEHLHLKSLKTLLHYIRMRGFEASLSLEALDPQRSKSLSRLSLLQSTMKNHPHVEWLWWVPNEALIITDPSFKLPLWNYTKFSFVLLGSVGATYQTENLIINLVRDTFLIRNCHWSLEVVRNAAEMSSMGVIGTDILTINSVSKPDLAAVRIFPIDTSLPNQGGRGRERVFVEDSAVLLGNPTDLAFELEEMSRDPHTGLGRKIWPFITQFVGCEFCHDLGKGEVGNCLEQMQRVSLFVEEKFEHRGRTMA
ncbi:hypothetical protein L7F22_014519 [Adiantum nelumboides]|nr:hypothetical protein [Adiantum nelumboides]